jgi:16S rRNA processing protein RimM
MRTDDCFNLGYIVRPQGLKGAFQIFLDVSDPNEYREMESVFVEIDKQLVPFFIERILIGAKGKATVHFEDINDPDQARSLAGKKLYLPLDVLPELEGNHFYYHEIEGFKLRDQNDDDLGTVVAVREAPAQDLIASAFKGREILIPLLDNTVIDLDRDNQTMKINCPEGLLSLFFD